MGFTNTFASIPTRKNSDVVDATWWNYLQIAGAALEALLGGGAGNYIPYTKFSIANNQSSVANVTGLVIDHTVNTAAQVPFEVRIKTATNELVSSGKLTLLWRALTSTWDIIASSDGDDTGVVFSVTSAGQVQYTSTNVSGSGYAASIKFFGSTFGV